MILICRNPSQSSLRDASSPKGGAFYRTLKALPLGRAGAKRLRGFFPYYVSLLVT